TRLTENCPMNDGPTSFRLGLRGWKTSAEASIVDRDVQLAQQIPNARLHVAHLSAADSLKAVRRGKRSRARVTCEVTPHHFTLTDEAVDDYDANCKMNPPLRSAADIESLVVARGSHADVTICDPKKRWTFDVSKSWSLSRNSPFDGWQLTGRVIATIVGGRVVYRGE